MDRTRELLESQLSPDPLHQLMAWREEADPGSHHDLAMTLATASREGRPSARLVLLRDIRPSGLAFYTNYESRKARELDENPWAAGVIHWPEWDRQVRIEGSVERLAATESDAYFARRPLGNRISAWASPQSRVVADRHELEQRVEQLLERYRHARESIPRPPSWGGYRLVPDVYEFWQGRMHRLHDRLRYRRGGVERATRAAAGDAWIIERLAP